MEASAIQVGPGLGRPRITLGAPLLRLRSDQQLVTLFREGNEDAFSVIHDRYRSRLFGYVRQMLPGRPGDVEDALQDVFVRTYAGLRSSNHDLALRPWLYRVAHNRCIDELRRPVPLAEPLEAHDRASHCDPVHETEQRESLRRLVVDIGRLPDQQRSALLMREMCGMTYAEVACALSISVPAVKSLLVRARIGLAQAVEARDAACLDIRRELADAHEEGVRPSWMARRHLRDCAACRACRTEMRSQSRQVAALAPAAGPLAVLAKLFGIGSGAGGGTATAASAGGASAAGAGGTATAASGLATITVGHVATILAAAVVTAGGAVAVQQTVASHSSHHGRHASQNAALAGSAASAAKAATMRMPALHPAPAPPTRHGQASTVRLGPAPSPPSSASTSQRWNHIRSLPGLHAVPPTATAAATSSASTCTPPPTACTASETNTCATGSGSTTSSGTQATGGQTTTTGATTTSGAGSTTTGSGSATGSGSTSGSSNTTGSGSGATESGTTSGSTASAAAGTAGGTTASSCSATGGGSGSTATGSTGSGSSGTGSTGTGSTGSGSTGTGSTGSGSTGTGGAVEPT